MKRGARRVETQCAQRKNWCRTAGRILRGAGVRGDASAAMRASSNFGGKPVYRELVVLLVLSGAKPRPANYQYPRLCGKDSVPNS